MRYSETEASKEFIIPTSTTGTLFKTTPSFLNRVLEKIRKGVTRSILKTFSTIFLITVFSWFSINTQNVVQGVVEIAHGDLGGFSTILQTPNLGNLISEAYQVAIGKDYSWLEYKKETGKDLAIDFVYVGNKQSLTRGLITIKQYSKYEDSFEDSCTREMPDNSLKYSKTCDEPATVIELGDAEEFCKKVYGAKVANYYELRDIIGVLNPVTNTKLKNYKEYHEMTSSLNPKDDDEFRVFYSGKTKSPKYVDFDSPIIASIGFRCFIRI